MKKFAALTLAALILLSMCACGTAATPSAEPSVPAAPAETAAAAAPAAPRVFEVASGSSSGAFYLQITPIAALWETLDFVSSCSVQATTGSMENTVLVSTGVADAGLTDSFAFVAATNGTEPYSEPYTGYSAIAAGAPSLCTILVREDSDIYSVADLKGHSIAVGAAGSGAEFQERFILEAFGLKYEDFTQVDMVGIGPGLTNFQDGKDDAVILLGGAGNSNVMEAMTNVKVRFLSFSDEEVATVLEACPFLSADVIPAGSYDGLTEDIQTVSTACILIVRDDVPADQVYQMTDVIYKNIDSLKSANVNFEKWSFGIGCTGSVPLHPGAEQYYKDNNLTA